MTDHVILYRQITLDETPRQYQGYCSCSWESAAPYTENWTEDEIANHLYQVWLSQQEEPV